MEKNDDDLTILKNISQLGWWFPTEWKNNPNVPNHQPALDVSEKCPASNFGWCEAMAFFQRFPKSWRIAPIAGWLISWKILWNWMIFLATHILENPHMVIFDGGTITNKGSRISHPSWLIVEMFARFFGAKSPPSPLHGQSHLPIFTSPDHWHSSDFRCIKGFFATSLPFEVLIDRPWGHQTSWVYGPFKLVSLWHGSHRYHLAQLL